VFGKRLSTLRKERGWSLRRLARECGHAPRRLGFGVRAPDRYQLMDYEGGRSNAHPRTKLVIAAALGVAVDQVSA
jgi:transcriptional regulator with XRE-family HTH domain